MQFPIRSIYDAYLLVKESGTDRKPNKCFYDVFAERSVI